MTDHDRAVQAWYTERFFVTDLGYKCFDWRLLGVAPMIYGRVVLNCGCGYPLDEMALAPRAARWVALDFIPAVLERCRAMVPTLPVEWVRGDMRALAFADGEFHTILDFSSSDHIAEGRARVRSEAFRVLQHGGHYVVTFANRAFYADGLADAPGEFGFEHRFSADELQSELVQAGFTIRYADMTGARSGVVAVRP